MTGPVTCGLQGRGTKWEDIRNYTDVTLTEYRVASTSPALALKELPFGMSVSPTALPAFSAAVRAGSRLAAGSFTVGAEGQVAGLLGVLLSNPYPITWANSHPTAALC